MKTILVDAVGCFVSEQGEIYEPLHELLEQYPNRKILLTNADYEAANKYSLNDMPYEIFTLKRDPMKTNPAYFETMLKSYSLTKDDVVYFEHNLEALQSAEHVGIVSHLYDEDKKDLDLLKDFLDSNL